MVQCYLVNELSKNGDGFNTSAYLYKETGSEPMKMGPLWDYDLGFGNNNYEDLLPQPSCSTRYTARSAARCMPFRSSVPRHSDSIRSTSRRWQMSLR